jgi:hypothetical protein
MTNITGHFTCDNNYQIWVGDVNQVITKLLEATNDHTSEIFNGQDLPPFQPGLGSYLYICAWSDKQAFQGLIGSFTGGITIHSGDPLWRVLPTWNNKDDYQFPTAAEINYAIAHALPADWKNPIVGAPNGGPPWNHLIAGITTAAHWMWYDSENDPQPKYPVSPYVPFGDGFNHGEFLIFRIPCDALNPPQEWCCPGKNLLQNGDFEVGNTGFTSQYAFNASTAANATKPGQYNIVNSAAALSISPLWVANDHFACKGGSGKSKFMVVNGKTCQSGWKTIWKETAPVSGGKEYRFCANVKNFKQWTFDITPGIDVKFTAMPSGVHVPSNIPPMHVSTVQSDACDWKLISGTVTPPIGSSSMTVEILLDETGMGDGNDLALDDISLQLKSDMNPNYVLVDITPHNIGGGKYNVSANPINLPSGYDYWWEVCTLDAAGNPITCVTNISAWWTSFPCVFNTYNGTSPGTFFTNTRYRITFGAWSDCVAWGQSSWLLQESKSSKKIEVSQIKLSEQEQKPPVGDRGGGVVGGVRNVGTVGPCGC